MRRPLENFVVFLLGECRRAKLQVYERAILLPVKEVFDRNVPLFASAIFVLPVVVIHGKELAERSQGVWFAVVVKYGSIVDHFVNLGHLSDPISTKLNPVVVTSGLTILGVVRIPCRI